MPTIASCARQGGLGRLFPLVARDGLGYVAIEFTYGKID